MLEPLYKAIRDHLKEQVPELMIIDLDIGQLEMQADNYPILPPAVFIDFAAPAWINTSQHLYICDVQCVFRIVFDVYEDVSNLTPTEVSDAAFEKLALQDKIHKVLAGFEGSFFNQLTLVSGPLTERRDDGYKVYEYTYVTNVRNSGAMKEYTELIDINVVVAPPVPEDGEGPAPHPIPDGER